MPGTASLIWLAAGLAAASVALAAAPLPRLFAGESGLPTPRPAAPPGAARPPVSIDPILELSPFGRLRNADAGTSAQQDPSLGLLLHGVVITGLAAESTAIISGEGKPAKVYRIGDDITATATLAAVFVDHVELLVDGSPQELTFPKAVRASVPESAPPEADLGALRQLIAGAAQGYSAASGAASTPDPASAETDSGPEALDSRIERYRAALRSDPQMLLDELGLAAFEDGYHVSMTASDDLLSVGLIPGDIVSTVNGQQVGNIDQDRAYFDDVISSGRATLGVVRQGERLMVSLLPR
jgi:general secretion pathway protein C